MSSIKVPITKTDKGGFQVTIDLNLYSEKAITATITNTQTSSLFIRI